MKYLKIKTQDFQKLNIIFLYYSKLDVIRKETIKTLKILSPIIQHI